MESKLDELVSTLDLNGAKLAHWGVKGMRWGIRNDSRAYFVLKAKSSSKSYPPVDIEKMNQELDQQTQKYAVAGDYSEEARQKALNEREAIFRKHIKDPVVLAATLKRYVIRHSDSHSNVESFLAHWGVKGMRWGIRRSDAELAADAVRAKATASAIKKSGTLGAVSDSDLQHLTSRLNLEKKYSDAVSSGGDTPSAATKGHTIIRRLLGVGDTMNKAYRFAHSPAGIILGHKLGVKTIPSGPGRHRG